jgi:cytochrome c biogenesis protein CcmG/thiol:disulfide interchange protein DsbE
MSIQNAWNARTALRLVAAAALTTSLLAGCGNGAGAGAANAGTADAGSSEAVAIGKAAPELSADYIAGEGPKNLAEAKGRVVVIDFWGTYCGPCKKSFPKYQSLVEEFNGELAVIAVSVDSPEDVKDEDLKAFADQTGAKFPILWDKTRKTAEMYKPEKMPTSILLDKEGNVRHIHAGFKDGEEEEIAKEVRELLGAK